MTEALTGHKEGVHSPGGPQVPAGLGLRAQECWAVAAQG